MIGNLSSVGSYFTDSSITVLFLFLAVVTVVVSDILSKEDE